MLPFKKYIIGFVVGLVLGMWWGVNLGKDQPFWDNPFADRSVKTRAQDKAEDILDQAKRAVRDKLED